MDGLYGLLMPMEHEPMTTGEVAATFGVSPNTVKRWADAGELAYFLTPGGHYRFDPADVAALKQKTP